MSETPVPEYLRRSMVETVARSLARYQVMSNLRLDAAQGKEPLSPERIEAAIGHAWKNYATEARIAIDAMREPNLAMRKVCSFSTAEIVWPAMIDAALTSPSPAEEGEGMKIMARSQSEPGSQASPEALSDLRPAGVDPSRMQWQPIATAPMDGTEVLVALNNWVIAARYCDPQGWYEVNNHWTDSWGGEVYPSHWMPFPLPPAQGIEALQGRDEGSACESPVGRQSDAPIPSPTPEP